MGLRLQTKKLADEHKLFYEHHAVTINSHGYFDHSSVGLTANCLRRNKDCVPFLFSTTAILLISICADAGNVCTFLETDTAGTEITILPILFN